MNVYQKTQTIADKLTKYYVDKGIAVQVGYQFLSNNAQVEFSITFVVNKSMETHIQYMLIDLINGLEPQQCYESLLALFDSVAPH